MVDFQLAYQSSEHSPTMKMPLFGGGVIEEPTQENAAEVFSFDVDGGPDHSMSYDDTESTERGWVGRAQETNLLETHLPGQLTAKCYRLLPAKVWGYVFLSRKWCKWSHQAADIPRVACAKLRPNANVDYSSTGYRPY